MRRKNEDAEDAISRAIREGALNNLPGRGKPLDLDGYLNEDPETRVTNRMLKSNGYSAPWIEEMKEIDRELQQARARLKQAWGWRQGAAADATAREWAERRWTQECDNFRAALRRVNSQILTFNLKVPVLSFQRSVIDPEREIRAVAEAPAAPR